MVKVARARVLSSPRVNVPWWGADAAAIVFALVAVGVEMRSGVIPNALAACALVAGAVTAGLDGAWLVHFGGFLLALVPGLVLWQRGAAGGGLVKLFAGCGLLVGFRDAGVAWLVLLLAVCVARLVPRWRGRWVPGAPVLCAALVVAAAAHALAHATAQAP